MAMVANTQRLPYAEISYVQTAYANSGQTKVYNDSLQRGAAEADGRILGYLSERDEIRRLFSLVDHARNQGADWDDEEGKPVSSETARRAQFLLRDVARRAEAGGKGWSSPAISATPDGGIHFSWLVGGSRVALTIFAPFTETVCVSKLRGESSHRELLSDGDAVERVLQAFESSPLASSDGNGNNPR